MLWFIIIGFISGIISGMGIGGGAVMIPALGMLMGVDQRMAQNINLIYFIPTAAIALMTHKSKGNIETSVVWRIALAGLVGAAAGSYIALSLDPGILRKAFGFFLLGMGVYEFFKREETELRQQNKEG